MLVEAVAAATLGLAALWVVLQPLLRPGRRAPVVYEPPEPEETPKGIALAALKEIEFDRETGKLSDADYESLKSKYTAAALEALRAESAADDDVEAMIAARRRVRTLAAASPICSICGPRPEPDAVFCSTCGTRLPALTAP